MQSHERCSVVEVMGRNAGYLAMYVGLAVDATAVLVPEKPIDFEQDVVEKIRRARLNGFTHYMIVVAEGAGSAAEIATKIKEAIDLDPRVTVLGHIQRGGSPSSRDRETATRMGYQAVQCLLNGKANRVIATKDGRVVDIDMEEALASLSSRSNIHNIGWVDSNKVYDYFLASDLVVFPGTHSVLWEQACACGLPGIFRDWAGMHHVDVGGNAIFLQKDGVDAIECILSDLCDCPEKIADMKRVAQTKGIPIFPYSRISKRAICEDC
jgi:hypothetical protein